MSRLGDNSWGKTAVRVSKVHRGEGEHGFSELAVNVQLVGDVENAFLRGDNAGVLPTDTMRNTVYAFAQDRLGEDVEGFGRELAAHFLTREGVRAADIELQEKRWERVTSYGFLSSSTEKRTARVILDSDREEFWAGIDGLAVLKTTNSAFRGFPKDEYTTLPEADDRILATTINARWRYSSLPPDTTATWRRVRDVMLGHFFEDWSASVQHQGWMMGEAVLDAVAEISEVEFRLPNQHHIAFDLARFGMDDEGVVFQPTSEPFGDIRFRVVR